MSSIRRSMDRLDTFLPDSSPPFDLIENYIAKKTYYPPAICRVLAVLDRGYKHRATFNGEVGRNHDDLLDQWDAMQSDMRTMDSRLRDLGVHDTVANISRQTKQLSIHTEGRPRSSGSISSHTTLTQDAMSPPAQISPTATSSRGSSVRSGNRVTSLPPARRDSYLTPEARNRSVSTASTSSRNHRLQLPFFTPRSRMPMPSRPSTSQGIHGTGTGGLIPIQARPRWNASPIANVLGSPPTKVPAVVVTPSRIPRSGRATPTQNTPTTPLRPVSRMSPPASTPRSKMSAPRTVSNSSTTSRVSATPPVPKIPDAQGRRMTSNFSNTKGKTAIPRPSTAQGMNGRSVSSPAGQAPARWRG
jgi:Yeast cortical protein KAR9